MSALVDEVNDIAFGSGDSISRQESPLQIPFFALLNYARKVNKVSKWNIYSALIFIR